MAWAWFITVVTLDSFRAALFTLKANEMFSPRKYSQNFTYPGVTSCSIVRRHAHQRLPMSERSEVYQLRVGSRQVDLCQQRCRKGEFSCTSDACNMYCTCNHVHSRRYQNKNFRFSFLSEITTRRVYSF